MDSNSVNWLRDPHPQRLKEPLPEVVFGGHHVSPWVPQAANGEVVTRFADVVANGANHAGHALTNFLRFLILLPGIVALLIAEGCVRLDQQLVKKLGGEL